MLTHFHPDHTGLCGRVREASGGVIAMHEADHEMFEKMSSGRDQEWLDFQLSNLERAGAPVRRSGGLPESAQGDPPVGPESRPDRSSSTTKLIALAGRSLRAVYTGATRPATLLLPRGRRRDVHGDHVLQKTTPHVGNFVYPLEERTRSPSSWTRCDGCRRWTSPAGWGRTASITTSRAGRGNCLDHHEERLDHLYGAFAGTTRSRVAGGRRMKWYRRGTSSTMAKGMALSEAQPTCATSSLPRPGGG
ncbi:MBL fold metallo-hydrolase [Rhodococcus hoagii]|nr:MBL fold metallo-hydrolase [Prescottella equi]